MIMEVLLFYICLIAEGGRKGGRKRGRERLFHNKLYKVSIESGHQVISDSILRKCKPKRNYSEKPNEHWSSKLSVNWRRPLNIR